MLYLDPNELKIGYITLVATRKPAENVLPADFYNLELFEEVKDIWFSAS